MTFQQHDALITLHRKWLDLEYLTVMCYYIYVNNYHTSSHRSLAMTPPRLPVICMHYIPRGDVPLKTVKRSPRRRVKCRPLIPQFF